MNGSTRSSTVHREAAQEAGLGHLSIVSLLAGLVTAYGTFAVIAAIAASLLAAGDVDTDFRSNDWTGSGAVASVTAALILLVAYVFGGYVAARMARRNGVAHGIALAIATLVVGAVAGMIVAALTDDASIRSNLRSIGVPTTTEQITDVAVAGVVLSLAAIFVGSIIGGMLGERWHTKFVRRIEDPEIGASAAERRQLADAQEERNQRVAGDAMVSERSGDDGRRGRADRDDRSIDLTDDDRSTTTPVEDEPRYTEAEWRRIDEGVRRS